MPTSDWTPELPDVGALLRARTKDDVGNELGTFNAQTRPTDDQASRLIEQGVSDVSSVIGTEVPERFWPDAINVAALAAALRIELSFFPEQINTGRSPYPQLKQLMDDQLKRLLTAIENENNPDPGGGAGGAPPRPSFYFPSPRVPGSWAPGTPGTYPPIVANRPGYFGGNY